MALQNTKYLVRELGGPLTTQVTSKPSLLGANEVLIHVKSIAVNPADYKMIDQGHRITAWPLVPGLDGAGVVDRVGEAVQRFSPGDRVTAQFVPGERGASYQTFAAVKEDSVARIPDSWSFENAASLGYVAIISKSIVNLAYQCFPAGFPISLR